MRYLKPVSLVTVVVVMMLLSALPQSLNAQEDEPLGQTFQAMLDNVDIAVVVQWFLALKYA